MLQRPNPANASILVNIDGRLVPRDRAGISPFDSSVQNGDAVWEGLRVYDGRVFRLEAHLARLRSSAAALRYEGMPTDETLVRELARTLEANGMRDGIHVRLTVSRGLKYTSGLDPRINTSGCSFFILAEHKPPVFDNTAGIRLVVVRQRRPFADVLDQHIHSCNQLTSILAKMEATAAGADDAILLDPAGMVAETSSTHVFVVRGGTVVTPTTRACPEGITRAVVLALCGRSGIAVEQRDIPRDELAMIDEAFVTGTMGEITPVAAIDDRRLEPVPGGVTARITTAFRACTRDPAEGTPLVP
jgi:branched-chain amino acid aminotransferase